MVPQTITARPARTTMGARSSRHRGRARARQNRRNPQENRPSPANGFSSTASSCTRRAYRQSVDGICENQVVRLVLSSSFALVLALGVLAGCGGGDDTTGSAGTEVTVNEPTAVDIPAGDPDATKTPQGADVLNQFEALRAAQGQPSVPAIRGSAGLSTTDWIHTVDGDVAAYWQKQFNGSGYKYSPAKELIFDKTLKSACGVKASVRTGPFYCTADQSIYFPLTFFQKYPEKFGDAATAIVVAHENAHRVQDILGLFDARGIISAQLELQADCLAGVWAKTVYQRGLLEEGDIGEILGLVNISGDSPGTPINSQGAHGNSQLRQKFFAQGYEGGDPGSCPIPKRSQIRALAG